MIFLRNCNYRQQNRIETIFLMRIISQYNSQDS